jgi:LEA14-like dessication related protein
MGIRDLKFRGARFAPLPVLLLVSVFTAGCASALKLEAPKLSVISMKVQSADLFSQRLQVRMRVQNPNDRELPIKGISYRIEVNAAELGQGQTDTPFVVPAMGEAEFDMQFTANLATALSTLMSRRGSSETIDYRLRGEVALSSGFLRHIPFDEHGSVKLK